MATVEKRGKFWRVKIRRQGTPAQTRTFDNKTVAQQWARSIETELDCGIVIDRRPAERTTLAEVLERYRREVTPTKRGELLSVEWVNVDLNRRTALLPITKNGESRGVPLSSRALTEIDRNRELLLTRCREIHGDA